MQEQDADDTLSFFQVAGPFLSFKKSRLELIADTHKVSTASHSSNGTTADRVRRMIGEDTVRTT